MSENIVRIEKSSENAPNILLLPTTPLLFSLACYASITAKCFHARRFLNPKKLVRLPNPNFIFLYIILNKTPSPSNQFALIENYRQKLIIRNGSISVLYVSVVVPNLKNLVFAL